MTVFKKTNIFGTFYYADDSYSLFHREDGPAVEYPNGYKVWYINGRRHRLNGPALISKSGRKEWYIKGQQISVNSQKAFEQYLKLIAFI
jgi:hypothetical protein